MHIIFVANQTCLILGKVLKMPHDRKRRSAVVMAVFLLMIIMVQPPAIIIVDLD